MMSDNFGMEEETMYEIGGDPADKFVDSVVDKDAMDDAHDGMDGEMSPVGHHEDGANEPVTKSDLLDVMDAIDEIKAAIFADKTDNSDDMFSDDDMEDDDMEDDDMEDDDMEDDDMEDDDMEDDGDMFGDDDMEDEDEEEEAKTDEEFIREYRDMVRGKQKDYTSGSPGESGVHAKSPVNSNPKDRPTTKASAHNIAQGDTETGGKMDGTKPAAPSSKSLVGSAKGKFTDGSTLNVDGKQTKGYDKSTKKPAKGSSGVNDKSVLPK
jgi:hypothetical protein